MESKVGWILSGPVSECAASFHDNVNFVRTHVLRVDWDTQQLETQLHKFWDLETLGISQNENHCYDKFSEGTKLNHENRYEVQLPFKGNHPVIHDNFDLSRKRLMNLYGTLKQNPNLLKSYDKMFKDQKEKGIIEVSRIRLRNFQNT